MCIGSLEFRQSRVRPPPPPRVRVSPRQPRRRAHATRLASVPEPGRDVTHAERVGRQTVAHAGPERRRQLQQDRRRRRRRCSRHSSDHFERQQVPFRTIIILLYATDISCVITRVMVDNRFRLFFFVCSSRFYIRFIHSLQTIVIIIEVVPSYFEGFNFLFRTPLKL